MSLRLVFTCIGSVGTFCAIGLFATKDEQTLLLQLKEAQVSVLADFAGPSGPILMLGSQASGSDHQING